MDAYLKRRIKKGDSCEAPERRYGVETSYLSRSFSLFRRAGSEYSKLLGVARDRCFTRFVLDDLSSLAEIAAISPIDD